MPEDAESARLIRIYEQLRERLLDMSLRNPMLSYKHRATSKRQLQIVDEVPESVYRLLVSDGAALEILPLPEPDEIPADERTEEFGAALDHARVADVEHQIQLQALESTVRDDEFALARLERGLRDKVRVQLGLAPRPNRKTINLGEHARSLGIDPSLELQARSSKPEHVDRKLQTLKWPDTLIAILERISDESRLSEQETGLSTLFLAFGFLEWREHDESSKTLFAPLLLLPVKLEKRRSARGKTFFNLAAIAETADSNLSLQKKLERDFGIRLPDFEADEETAAPIEGYFAKIVKAVEGRKGWNIRRWLTLGHFAFGRFAMYADLAAENWKDLPTTHPLVGSVVSGTEMAGDGGTSLLSPPDDYIIDDPEIENIAPILIHDADASQHSALVDVMKGRQLVIQGPPGTGKSQTITNIIANALAANKTVLFLAEKQAALDVVKRRLDTADLGEFCMELHSHKATPRLVIESLKTRYALGFGKRPRTSRLQADVTWEDSRREIGAYVSAMHKTAEDGQSPFDLIWRALRARSEAGIALENLKAVPLPKEILEAPLAYQQALGAVSIYARMASEFTSSHGQFGNSPWAALTFHSDANPSIVYGLIDDLSDLQKKMEVVAELVTGVTDLGGSDIPGLERVAALDDKLPVSPPDESLLASISSLDQSKVGELIDLKVELSNREQNAIPALRDVSEEIFVLARRLADATRGTHYANLSPRQIYEQANGEIEESTSLLDMLEAAMPCLEILDLDQEFPANGTDAVYCATFAATKLTEEMRPWFFWQPDAGIEKFQQAHAEWLELVKEEARWRGRFPSYEDESWPPSDALRAAAIVAKKNALGRFFGSMTSGAKSLSDVISRLGLPVGAKLPAEVLEALATHSQRLASFLSNRTHYQMLGDAWAGLDTPFDLIARTVAFSKTISEELYKLNGGEKIIAHLRNLSAPKIADLAACYEKLKRTFVGDQNLRNSLEGLRLQDAEDGLKFRRERAEQLLSVDASNRLTCFDLRIEELARGSESEEQRRHMRVRLAAHPYVSHVEFWAGSDGAISRTRETLDWARRVRELPMDDVVRERLLSRDVTAMRSRLAALSAQVVPVMRAVRDVAERIFVSYGTAIDLGDPSRLTVELGGLIKRRDELTEYLSLRDQRKALVEKGLAPFLDAVDQIGVDPNVLPAVFSGLVSQQRAEKIRRADPVLGRASGLRIEARREEFVERDKRKIHSDRKSVREALLTSIPPRGDRIGSRKSWTEMELLINEFGKERGFAPVRDLMRRAGSAIQVMKPCFMMSPLSLAKFLPAGRLGFDLVVIDEASQMRPEDALGGLIRAKQMVVVGDQKQLPPTDFFSRLGDSDSIITDDEDEFEDLDDESILEACQKTFRQIRLLRWHYRSRCESLIAFSNREFYRGELITFPMARPDSFSVDLVRVNGTYVTRRNPAEAQRVAEEAIEFMRHFAEATANEVPTLGIVAVNGEQRDLIFEEIRRLEVDDELVELYREKVAEKGEPVFVKNLENVQGDERDFIFISMTYGPKPGTNAVLQRFGPITGKQGHRRLNVLFSRARMRIGLFTSMGSADVKPSNTSAEGIHVLKRYLEYAEGRGRAPVENIGDNADSDFELEVADRLRANGYSVDLQVGVSGFRIDLGVRHPEEPERFLAGVECDGARYHSSKSARDRDRLREEVLRDLGWDIVRVWSTDWFDNPDLQTERLVKRLEELREKPGIVAVDYRNLGGGPVAAKPASDVAGHAGVGAEDPKEFDPFPSSSEMAGDVSETVPAEIGKKSSAMDLLDGDGPLTEEELHQALLKFREKVIAAEMEGWEQHRSILRDGMIETLVAQRLIDPKDWFQKVPQFQRSGTNPVEKSRYLEAICRLVGRVENVPGHVVEARPVLELTPDAPPSREQQGNLFGLPRQTFDVSFPPVTSSMPSEGEKSLEASQNVPLQYVVADVTECGVKPDPGRFYDSEYRSDLGKMIAHVIAVEGPIYDDQLVTRVARAHGFMRNGANIVERVMRIVGQRYPRTHEGGRDVIWPSHIRPAAILPLRGSNGQGRDHVDIPLVELASLAVPMLKKQRDLEDVVAYMRDFFGLGRLRHATRQRFEAAVRIARENMA